MSLAVHIARLLAEGHARQIDILSSDGGIFLPEAEIIPASVLVAITDRPQPGVVLTQRPETMRKHPGQVAFPGGRQDEGDADSIAAALREAEEEIALDRSHAAIIGETDAYVTGTGFRVTPVLAVIPPDLPLHPNDEEVAAIFEVPLAFLLDPANHVRRTMEWKGAMRTFHEMNWQDRRIWGATAAMIINLSRRLAWT